MSTAVFEAISGLEITLPSGKIVKAKPLSWRRAIEFVEILEKAKDDGEPYLTTLTRLVELLPEAVGLAKEDLDELDLGQIDDLVSRFFHLGRNGQPPPVARATVMVGPSTSTT